MIWNEMMLNEMKLYEMKWDEMNIGISSDLVDTRSMVCNNVILILPYYPHGKLLHELVLSHTMILVIIGGGFKIQSCQSLNTIHVK